MSKLEKFKDEVSAVNDMLEQILDDRTVPKNIRLAAEESIETLKANEEIEVKISAIVGLLDEIINDPNMPMYTRTRIWNIVSILEQIREDE